MIEEKVATEDVLGFYVAMLDNFEDYLKKEQPAQKESTDSVKQNVVDSIINKIKDLDAAQIDNFFFNIPIKNKRV